jgi:hypothetical protein
MVDLPERSTRLEEKIKAFSGNQSERVSRGMGVSAYRRIGVSAYRRIGVSACGRVGVWACGRVGVWACGRVGVWACGRVGDAARRPGTVGRKTRRADGSVRASRQSAPVLSRGAGCDTAQENRTAFNSQRRSVIAAHDNGSKPARNCANRNNTIGAPSFSPCRSCFQPLRIAHSPFGRIAPAPLSPGCNYPFRILGKFVYLIQGQPEMICHQLCRVRGQP